MKKFYPAVAGRLCLALCLTLLIQSYARAQIVTYDTAFDGWNAIVTEDLSLHGNDSAPGIIFFPGIDQQTKNIKDLLVNGPHYLIKNKIWDGSVTLGNGVHHPFIISLQPPAPGYPATVVKPKIDAILARYRIKRRSLYFTALSQGAWQANEFLAYEAKPGDHSYGSMVRAMVNLEGVEPADNTGVYSSLAYPNKMGHWARACGGRELWVEGSQDWRDMLAGAQNMMDSVPGSATYFQVKYDGGGHCCWNTEYEPGVTWTKASNSNISQVVGNQVPMNVWQWLLRQGDTSMPGGASAAAAAPTAIAGNATTITLPVNSVNLTGTGTGNSGAKVSSMSWTQTAGPNKASIKAGGLAAAVKAAVGVVLGNTMNLGATVSGLVAGSYTFQLTVKDNGGKSSAASVAVTVKAAAPPPPTPKSPAPKSPAPITPAPAATPPVVSAGKGQAITLPATSVTIKGTATGQGGATLKALTWKQGAGPVAAKISSPASISTTISGMTVAGSYIFTLTATDSKGQQGSGSMTVVVSPAKSAAPAPSPAPGAKTPPTVSGGKGQLITLPASSAALQGAAAGNGGATIKALSWKQGSGPVAAKIGSPNSLSTTVTGMTKAGNYVFTLTATDSKGVSANGSMTVTVQPEAVKAPPAPEAKTPPTVNAGGNQTITLPTNSVTLKGSATGHNGAVVNSYFWMMLSGPGWVSFYNEWAPSTTVSGLTAGTYVFEFAASDNDGQTSSSTMTVVVKPKPAKTEMGGNARIGDAVVDPSAADSINRAEGLVIYPNPVHDLLNVHLTSQLTGKVILAIFNMSGTRIQSIELDKESWSLQTGIDVSRLAAGMYMLEILNGPRLPTIEKFIKQ